MMKKYFFWRRRHSKGKTLRIYYKKILRVQYFEVVHHQIKYSVAFETAARLLLCETQ
jgi:hypothetical protein